MASADTGNAIIKNNARLRGHTIKRFGKIRELYVGNANNSDQPYFTSPLSPEELKAGRERAIQWAKTRNKKIYTSIVILTVLVLCLVAAAWRYFLM